VAERRNGEKVLLIVGASISIICLLTFVGFPLAQLVVGKNGDQIFLRLPAVLSLSILFGFSVSALSATISYGVIGLDYYPAVLISLSMVSWITYVAYAKKGSFKPLRVKVEKSDFSLLFILVWCLVLTRSQWETFTKPQLVSGDGPDTSQNLMTALSARTLGGTWSEQADKINTFFGHDSLRQSVYDLYRFPSFREQAGFDYLVYGTRWGLSVPYSQVLRFFGDKAILWETGIVITTSLFVLGLMVFGIASLITTNKQIPLVASLISVSNSLLLVQYFNGGLSQVWSLSGLLGISLALILIVSQNQSGRNISIKSVMAISVASWTILIATYVDAAVILGLLGLVTSAVFLLIDRKISFKIVKNFALSGAIALLINPVLTYATFLTFDLRLKAATGTGLTANLWSFPSEIFGYIDVFSSEEGKRSFETMFLGLVISGAILVALGKKIYKRQGDYLLGYLSLAAFVVVLIGFIISYTGKLQTNYIYNKVAIYVTPLIIILWLTSFKSPGQKSSSNSTNKTGKSTEKHVSKIGFALSLFVVTSVPMLSSFSATNSLSTQGTTIPYEFANLIENKDLQERVSEYNYLTPYILSANFLGVIANVHWVSKAPNDIKLDSRQSKEMRLICYSVDTNCKPTTSRISDPELEKFGFIQFESPISTEEFSKLSPRDRYKFNFEVFGTAAQEIPERFIGGNPYYN
jgi:hypothetical protein